MKRSTIQQSNIRVIYVPENVVCSLLQKCQLPKANEVSVKQIKRVNDLYLFIWVQNRRSYFLKSVCGYSEYYDVTGES